MSVLLESYVLTLNTAIDLAGLILLYMTGYPVLVDGIPPIISHSLGLYNVYVVKSVSVLSYSFTVAAVELVLGNITILYVLLIAN